ncbi:BEACH domain-containing protein, partial [Tanacetum coccineum]
LIDTQMTCRSSLRKKNEIVRSTALVLMLTLDLHKRPKVSVAQKNFNWQMQELKERQESKLQRYKNSHFFHLMRIHAWLGRKSALEIFMLDRSTLFFDFGTVEARMSAFQAVVHARPPRLNNIYLGTQRSRNMRRIRSPMDRKIRTRPNSYRDASYMRRSSAAATGRRMRHCNIEPMAAGDRIYPNFVSPYNWSGTFETIIGSHTYSPMELSSVGQDSSFVLSHDDQSRTDFAANKRRQSDVQRQCALHGMLLLDLDKFYREVVTHCRSRKEWLRLELDLKCLGKSRLDREEMLATVERLNDKPVTHRLCRQQEATVWCPTAVWETTCYRPTCVLGRLAVTEDIESSNAPPKGVSSLYMDIGDCQWPCEIPKRDFGMGNVLRDILRIGKSVTINALQEEKLCALHGMLLLDLDKFYREVVTHCRSRKEWLSLELDLKCLGKSRLDREEMLATVERLKRQV